MTDEELVAFRQVWSLIQEAAAAYLRELRRIGAQIMAFWQAQGLFPRPEFAFGATSAMRRRAARDRARLAMRAKNRHIH